MKPKNLKISCNSSSTLIYRAASKSFHHFIVDLGAVNLVPWKTLRNFDFYWAHFSPFAPTHEDSSQFSSSWTQSRNQKPWFEFIWKWKILEMRRHGNSSRQSHKSEPKGSVRLEIPWIRTFRTQKTQMIFPTFHVNVSCSSDIFSASSSSKEKPEPRPQNFTNIQMEIVLELLRLF